MGIALSVGGGIVFYAQHQPARDSANNQVIQAVSPISIPVAPIQRPIEVPAGDQIKVTQSAPNLGNSPIQAGEVVKTIQIGRAHV